MDFPFIVNYLHQIAEFASPVFFIFINIYNILYIFLPSSFALASFLLQSYHLKEIILQVIFTISPWN